jgi:hypothetical protein
MSGSNRSPLSKAAGLPERHAGGKQHDFGFPEIGSADLKLFQRNFARVLLRRHIMLRCEQGLK